MELKKIPLNNISADKNSFDLFGRLPSQNLVESVNKYGVLQPLYAIQKNDAVQLISGFRRFRAATSAGLEYIQVILIPQDTSPQEQLQLCLNLAVEEKPLPIMALSRLARAAELIVEEPIQWLNGQNNRQISSITADIFCRLKNLLESPLEVQNYFQKFDAPLSIISTFLRQEKENILKIIDFADKFRIRPVELEKIILDIVDCSKNCDTDFETMWKELTENLPEGCEGKKRNEFLNKFKLTLSGKRYPYLSKLREESKTGIGAFKKLCGVETSFDPTFESPEIKLSLSFKNINELEEINKKLLSEEGRKSLEKLLK